MVKIKLGDISEAHSSTKIHNTAQNCTPVTSSYTLQLFCLKDVGKEMENFQCILNFYGTHTWTCLLRRPVCPIDPHTILQMVNNIMWFYRKVRGEVRLSYRPASLELVRTERFAQGHFSRVDSC